MASRPSPSIEVVGLWAWDEGGWWEKREGRVKPLSRITLAPGSVSSVVGREIRVKDM